LATHDEHDEVDVEDGLWVCGGVCVCVF
jgi:hypothetical protein